MAEGKKSFIAYADWKEVFDELPNEEAGMLIKHIFSYVNDENPETDNFLIRAVFANIKATLKRDLKKWEKQLCQRKEAGRKSAEIRSTKINERSTVVDETVRNPTDSVSVSVSVNDSVSVSNTATLPHEDVVKETLGNEIFIEQSAMLLKIGINDFRAHCDNSLRQMAITGKSSRYPLGTVKNIIIQDYKFEREGGKRGFNEPQTKKYKPL